MKDEGPYRLIGLWQVWERGEKSHDPTRRPPEFLLERLCGTFEAFPDDPSWQRAVRAGDAELERDASVEQRRRLGCIVVGAVGWPAIQDHRPFGERGGYRHVHGSSKLDALHVYGLRPISLRSKKGRIWAPYVANYGPSFETVMGRLRDMAIEQGLEPGPIEPDVPDLAPVRIARRQRSLSVDR